MTTVADVIAWWDNADHPPESWQLDTATELCRRLGLRADMSIEDHMSMMVAAKQSAPNA